jgi:hypothetical protein
MKQFLVQIRAYGYFTKFTISSLDAVKDIENAILDKLGQNDVKWEKTGFYDLRRKWITYEEVNHDRGPIQTKEVLGVELGAGTP